MVQAIISDIHANYEALQAVLEKINSMDIEDIICLGDILGYGPSPAECVDAVVKTCSTVLCGNHDLAVLDSSNTIGFHSVAKAAAGYHRSLMKPGPEPKVGLFGRNREQREEWEKQNARWNYLQGLSPKLEANKVIYVHASPRKDKQKVPFPASHAAIEYIRSHHALDITGVGVSDIVGDSISEDVDGICFVGHSHQPGIVTHQCQWLLPRQLPDATYTIPDNCNVLCNVGSVGQPRDGDPRACFVTWNKQYNTIQFHRVEYDIGAVIRKIVDSPLALDNSLGERLKAGK